MAGVILWMGDPDCQAAHNATLSWLMENCPTFYSTPSAGDNILKGNLGETISFCVGYWYVLSVTKICGWRGDHAANSSAWPSTRSGTGAEVP